METIKNNTLIAEFMGMQNTDIGWFDNEEELVLPHTNDNTFDKLLFHKSWDWLMPVVKKIEQLDYVVYIQTGGTVIRDNAEIPIAFEFRKKSKIEHCYKAVVKFIKWYNESK